jgi:lipopolysaccharide export system permease protein
VFTLSLNNGEIHEIDEENPERALSLKFRKHTIHIPMDTELIRREREFRSDRELSASALLERVKDLGKEITAMTARLRESGMKERRRTEQEIERKRRQINKYLVEVHKKYAIPVACIVFVLVGAPIGYHLRRGGLGIGMGVSLGFFLLYYLGLMAGEEIADRAMVSPWLAIWLPNILLGGAGVALNYLTNESLPVRFWRS